MQSINLYNIQLLDLELFLSVAKYGSFTKAGEQMFVSQPWVSKRMSQLESSLGLALFVRNGRNIALTPAGRTLADHLQKTYYSILDGIQNAHAVQCGISGTLSIGFLEWSMVVFMNRIERFIAANPHISVEIYRQQFANLRNDLTNGRYDVIFTMSYDCDQFPDAQYNKVNMRSVPLMAYMHVDHPLAQKDALEVEDLRSEPIFMVDQKASSGYSELILNMFHEKNIRPLIAQYANDGGAHIGGILVKKGILLASKWFLHNSWEKDIARVPINGTELFVTAVWRKDNNNPALTKFVESVVSAEVEDGRDAD